MNDILDLTYFQFKNIFDGVTRKILFQIKLKTIGYGGELDESDLPFYSNGAEEDRVFKIDDAMELSKLAKQ